MRYQRWLVAGLAVLAIVQAVGIEIADREHTDPSVGTFDQGHLSDARLRTTSPGRRIDALLPSPSLGSLVSSNSCSVLVFFSSTCPALPSIAPKWRGIDSIPSASGPAPVHWIAIFPDDSLAADSASILADVKRVHWMVVRDAASVRGIDLIPRAWIVDDQLRVFDVTHDPSQAAEAVEACAAANATSLVDEVD